MVRGLLNLSRVRSVRTAGIEIAATVVHAAIADTGTGPATVALFPQTRWLSA